VLRGCITGIEESTRADFHLFFSLLIRSIEVGSDHSHHGMEQSTTICLVSGGLVPFLGGREKMDRNRGSHAVSIPRV